MINRNNTCLLTFHQCSLQSYLSTLPFYQCWPKCMLGYDHHRCCSSFSSLLWFEVLIMGWPWTALASKPTIDPSYLAWTHGFHLKVQKNGAGLLLFNKILSHEDRYFSSGFHVYLFFSHLIFRRPWSNRISFPTVTRHLSKFPFEEL